MMATTIFFSTPLYFAAVSDSLSVAELLLSNGADVMGGPSRRTPLHAAAGNDSLGVAALLVANGADVNATDYSGNTPLFDAAQENAVSVVQYLIEQGADVNIKNDDNVTALNMAYGREAYGRKVTDYLLN